MPLKYTKSQRCKFSGISKKIAPIAGATVVGEGGF